MAVHETPPLFRDFQALLHDIQAGGPVSGRRMPKMFSGVQKRVSKLGFFIYKKLKKALHLDFQKEF